MRKEQQALKILGDKVRYYRKLKGLSQSELAAGICTQATISLIEKHNKVPSMNILMRIINRLDVQLEDVVVEYHDRVQQILNDAVFEIHHRQFDAGAEYLDKIKVEQLKSGENQKRYYYYQGLIELLHHDAPDEAIYFFGRVLSPLVSNERDVFGILATLGMGLAYAFKQTFDRARVYIDQALRMLKGVPLAEHKFLELELTIYWHIARIYFELAEYKSVLNYATMGIQIATQHDSLLLLDEFYVLLARAQKASGDLAAKDSYAIAIALTSLIGHSETARSLVSESVINSPNSETA